MPLASAFVTSASHSRILAIETSAERYSVALAHAGTIVQQCETGGDRIAERALSTIATLLANQSITLGQIDAFAFSSGPGAFTGLRVACGLVQGLAFAVDGPVIPVGSLRALAFAACQRLRRPARVMAATDARMGQVYWAVYEAQQHARPLAPAALAAPSELAALVAQWQPEVIAGDALRVLDAAWPAQAGPAHMADLNVDAAIIAEIARLDLADGRTIAARDAAPEYVRNQVALTVAQRNRAHRSAPR